MLLIGTIVVGFAMMTLGIGLLFVGEVPFFAGRRISATRSRLIGLVLVSFLPLAMAIRFAYVGLFGSDGVEGPVVTSFVFSFCCLATLLIMFRVMFPKRAPRKDVKATSQSAKKNPFGNDEEVIELEVIDDEAIELELIEDEPVRPAGKKAEPPKKPSAKKPARPAAERNPFDFT